MRHKFARYNLSYFHIDTSLSSLSSLTRGSTDNQTYSLTQFHFHFLLTSPLQMYFLHSITRYKLTAATHVPWTCITSDIQFNCSIQRNTHHHKSSAYGLLRSFYIRYFLLNHLSALHLVRWMANFLFFLSSRSAHGTQSAAPFCSGLFANRQSHRTHLSAVSTLTTTSFHHRIIIVTLYHREDSDPVQDNPRLYINRLLTLIYAPSARGSMKPSVS